MAGTGDAVLASVGVGGAGGLLGGLLFFGDWLLAWGAQLWVLGGDYLCGHE